MAHSPTHSTVTMAGESSTSNPGNVTTQAGDHSTLSQISGVTVIVGLVLSIIILFTLVGNGLVIMAVVSFRRLRSVTNYFVVSLAVADLTVAILVMPYSLLTEVFGEWRFGWIFCYFWISCDVTCCTASILHLCVISLDRYLAITKPLTYKSRMSKRRAIAMICAVWICSVAISFVPIYMGWFADPQLIELYVDSPKCFLGVNKVYAVISSTTSFYLPLVVMLFAYLKIFRIARSQAKEIKKLEAAMYVADQDKIQKRSKRHNKDSKAIKTLGTLMGLFCVTWVPFFLLYLIMPFCSSSCHVPDIWLSLITWLGYCNSFFNPCVYALLNRDFRLAFKKILLCGHAYPARGSGLYSQCCPQSCQKMGPATAESPCQDAQDPLQAEPTDYDSPNQVHRDRVNLPRDVLELVELNQHTPLRDDQLGVKTMNKEPDSISSSGTGTTRFGTDTAS